MLNLNQRKARESKILKEPLLEFGEGTHTCPKAGIETLGVYDIKDDFRNDVLKLGLVGRGEGLVLLDEWLEKCQFGIEPKESKYSNLFRGFGGLTDQHGFHAKFKYGQQSIRTIQQTLLNKIFKIDNRKDRVAACVDLYYDQIRFLANNRNLDVILCVIPEKIFESLTTETETEGASIDPGDEQTEEAKNSLDAMEYNFRRMLKARCMHLRIPLQLMREQSLVLGKLIPGQQDDATRAWNFCTALYYKGNKTVPWRLVEESHKPKTCYIGVGFYKSRDGETVSTSLAQVFDEYGHGVILRGTPVSMDKDDRRPFMNETQAYDLLNNALDEYENAMMQMPARIVIHKTSNFRQCEVDGFHRAIEEKNIKSKDFVTIANTNIKLFSYDTYPPNRGTLLSLSETEGILYTRGAVDFYKTYPGMYVPSPLEVRLFENDSSLDDICKEILGLSKMNWNNTQFDGRLPITLECAHRVGDIMKYVDENEKPQVNYSFYM